MYYCGSVNPQHKPHMMNVPLDDPQTYNWHSWANNQEIPGLWGRLPEQPAEYQTAIFEAINAKIALEPNMESSGSCSEMWCKGIIDMMVQTKQKIQDKSSADKSVLEVLESSVDVENNGCEKPVKKRRGRPKGVLNSTLMELQLLPKSPMKLRSKNPTRSSILSQNGDANSEKSLPEVAQEDMRDDISRSETIQSDISSAFKRVETLNQRTLKSNQLSLNQQTDLRAASNSSKIRPAENDVPALDLSKLFCKKFYPKFGKSLLLSTSARGLCDSSQEKQMQSTIAETAVAPANMMKSQSNSFRFDDGPSSFSDYTEPWDYSSDTCMVPNEESESSLYDE
ncbi:hypothetical protein BDR06DRAFT_978217, partial [Suillus hirtellus]